MSLTQNDRKVRSQDGKSFPEGDQRAGLPTFATAIAMALRDEFGESPSTMKTLARLTGSNERTVRNWLDEKNGPTGENLVVLMRHSDEVLQTVLQLADRGDLLVAAKIAATRTQLRESLTILDKLLSAPSAG